MKYKSILELDNRVEREIDHNVKHYYTDWKNYDRPMYMVCKGSPSEEDKELVLIARECGTYLIRIADIKQGRNWPNTIYDYYRTQEKANYYYINLSNLECKKIDPDKYESELRHSA